MENGVCVMDRRTEDCAGSEDADGDGFVPALDPDCMGPGSDGGVPDAGAASPDGGIRFQCGAFCYLLGAQDIQWLPGDAGRIYVWNDGTPIPSGSGITHEEVGLPEAFALKVCYGRDMDADGDGVGNCDDNCWRHPNPRPHGCVSNDGCVNAGGVCLSDGTCSGQLDTDHDAIGDVCDPRPGEDDADVRRFSDSDGDSDGISGSDDRCPALATSPEDNARDADKDGIPDACDACAYPNMACQP